MVTLRCQAHALPVIADYLPRGFTPPQGDEWVTVEVPFAHYGSLTQFVGAHPDVVTVLGPASAREAVASFAVAALEGYEQVS